MNHIKLFRFLPQDAALKTIEKWSFRVGRILELNDPFEWRIGLKNIRPEAEEFAEVVTHRLLRDQNEQFGVICFSDTADDPVLWSHYADRHKGIVIEVAYTLEPESIFKVVYTDARPTIDATQIAKPGFDEEARAAFARLIRTKSPGWAYEKEWRVCLALSECEARDGGYFKPIPSDFVKRIILGTESTIGVGYIERILSQHKITDVRVVKAKKSIDSFKILT